MIQRTHAVLRILPQIACLAVMAFAVSGKAWAQGPNLEEQIDKALKSSTPAASSTTSITRSFSGSRPGSEVKDTAEGQAIERLLTRSLTTEQSQETVSAAERQEISAITKDKPKIDLEIYFDYNSSAISPKAMPSLTALGNVLSKDEHRGTVFFINGHTDAVGGADYNLSLSQRRAESVRRVLIERYRLAPGTLVATGFGKESLKDPKHPTAAENRRVQIVNTEHKATASR